MAMDLQRVEIKNPTGILSDPNPSDVPPDAWTGGMNIAFRNGKAERVEGYNQVFSTPPLPPLHISPHLTQGTPFWISGSATKIHLTAGTTWTDYSRLAGGAYNASSSSKWNGGYLSGVAVLNNRNDLPQALLPSANNFVDLPNWPASYRARVMVPFKNYLVALNLVVDSVFYPSAVKWSSPADPGEVPSTWSITDPTNDAGETALADTPGAIVDARKMRDTLVIYKDDSVYSMRYVGGVFVFQFQQLFNDIGALAENCIAEFDGKHFVVGKGDVYVHNGVQKTSVIDGKMKEMLFNTMLPESAQATFVCADHPNTEMWICFAASGAASAGGYCDRALVWNWREDKWSQRQLPNVGGSSFGVVDPQDPRTWATVSGSWDSKSTPWASSTYNPSKTKVLLFSTANNKVYIVGDTPTFEGEEFTSTLERSDIYMGDDLKVKVVNSITPHIRGQGDGAVYVGTSMLQDSPVRWDGPFPFRIGMDHKIDCKVLGRYVGLRFEFPSSSRWELNGYTIEFVPTAGKR